MGDGDEMPGDVSIPVKPSQIGMDRRATLRKRPETNKLIAGNAVKDRKTKRKREVGVKEAQALGVPEGSMLVSMTSTMPSVIY